MTTDEFNNIMTTPDDDGTQDPQTCRGPEDEAIGPGAKPPTMIISQHHRRRQEAVLAAISLNSLRVVERCLLLVVHQSDVEISRTSNSIGLEMPTHGCPPVGCSDLSHLDFSWSGYAYFWFSTSWM